MLAPLLLGLIISVATILVARALKLDRDKATYACTMIAIALFYIVFAIEHGDSLTLAINIGCASIFILGALIGYKRSVTLIALLLVGHGLFDAVYHFEFHEHTPAPEWWAPFCFGVDFVFGGYLLWLQRFKPLES